MENIAIASEILESGVFFLHAENAEKQIDNDRNKFEDIDVNVIIYQQRIYALEIRRDCEDFLIVQKCGKPPLEIKEVAEAAKALKACVRINCEGWVTGDKESNRTFPNISDLSSQ